MDFATQRKSERREAFVNWPIVRAGMAERELDVLVAVSAASTFYLSGCYNDQQVYVRDRLSMVVVPTSGVATQIVCRGEEALVRANSWLEDVRTYPEHQSPVELLADVLIGLGVERRRVGLETEFFPMARYRQLERRLPGATLAEADAVLARARWLKMPAELERIRRAVVTADQAVHAAWLGVHAGDSERQIQAKMIAELAARGADRFLTALAAGSNVRISHHDASDRPIERGDLVSCGFAGFWDDYWSDNERMGTMGPPSSKQRDRYAALLEAVDGTVELIRPGIEVRELFDYPVKVLQKYGDKGRRPHMGHGMPRTRGHEDPMIQPNVRTLLEPNMLFVLEQGYRVDSERYMLSRLVQVTETGHRVLDDWWDIRELFIFD